MPCICICVIPNLSSPSFSMLRQQVIFGQTTGAQFTNHKARSIAQQMNLFILYNFFFWFSTKLFFSFYFLQNFPTNDLFIFLIHITEFLSHSWIAINDYGVVGCVCSGCFVESDFVYSEILSWSSFLFLSPTKIDIETIHPKRGRPSKFSQKRHKFCWLDLFFFF